MAYQTAFGSTMYFHGFKKPITSHLGYENQCIKFHFHFIEMPILKSTHEPKEPYEIFSVLLLWS